MATVINEKKTASPPNLDTDLLWRVCGLFLKFLPKIFLNVFSRKIIRIAIPKDIGSISVI